MYSERDIERAAGIIRSGGLVAFPTETVYGLGANALDPAAVEKIFLAKGRPQDNPLILHVGHVSDAQKYCFVDERAEALMAAFWPGPLTLVLRARDIVPLVTRGGLDTAAMRMPNHPAALALIRVCGLPVAAPSANKSGRPSPTSARVVADDLGGAVDMIIDAGPCEIGLESTVLDASGERLMILRPGGVSREDLERAGFVIGAGHGDERRSPGTRYRHYAPRVPVLLWRAGEALPDVGASRWGYVGMTEPPKHANPPAIKKIASSPREYARVLFSTLRMFDSSGVSLIVAEFPCCGGIGEAIRNRLSRAAQR